LEAVNIPPEVARAQGHHGSKGAEHGKKGGRPRLQLTEEERIQRRRMQKDRSRLKKGGTKPLGPKLPKFEADYFAIWGKLPGQPLTPEEFAQREPIWNARALKQQEAEKGKVHRGQQSIEELRNNIEQYERIHERKPYRAPASIGRNDPCPCGSGKKFKKCCGK